MNRDERELRKELEARSAAPSDEFRARLGKAFRAGRPKDSITPAIATFVAVALVVATVGVLTYVRLHTPVVTSGVASPARTQSPPPIYGPSSVELSAPSRDVVWALVAGQRLYRSTDRGTTWQERSLPARLGLPPSVSFIDDHDGWLLTTASPETQCEAEAFTIWRTTDAGATWTGMPAYGIPPAQCKELVYFVDSQHGFLSTWDDNHSPAIYATSDAGKTWRGAPVPDNPLFKTQGGGFALRVEWIKGFGQTVYAEASGTQPDATGQALTFIYTSTDGGATWKWKQKLASADTVMVTESRWLQFTPDVEESVNGGQMFAPYQTDFTPLSPVVGGTKVTFGDGTVGYATGRGSLERTADGGRSWTIIATPWTGVPPPTPSPPVDVQLSAPTASVVWALLDHTLFRSTDEGTTWDQRPQPSPGPPPTSISFISADEGWALAGGPPATQCSAGGVTIWHTTDAAATWQQIVSVTPQAPRSATAIGSEQCKESVTFTDAKHGYVTAWDPNDPPTIYRTADGGSTWSSAKLPDPPGFHTLAAGDALRAEPVRGLGSELLVAAYGMQPDGLRSYVFRSLDLGATWTALDQVPSGSVAFVTETRWIFLSPFGKSEETTTAGQQWHLFASDYMAPAAVGGAAMVFPAPAVGYAEGAVDAAGDAALLRTTDGGVHWTGIKPLGPAQSG